MSGIEWTDTTWNPVIGCELASPGCAGCYAATMAKRQVAMARGSRTKWARSLTSDEADAWVNQGVEPKAKRPKRSPYTDVVHIDEPGGKKRRGAGIWNGQTRFLPERLAEPLRWRKPRMVFAPSMSDFFHSSVSFEHVAAILGVMAATPQHTYQVLTKRPARLLEFLRWLNNYPESPHWSAWEVCTWHALRLSPPHTYEVPAHPSVSGPKWATPLPNVWFGVSVEDQKRADERLPLLAEVRRQGWHTFVSAEPLIGPISAGSLFPPGWSAAEWVIVGGESGPNARRCEADWMRWIVRDAREAACAVFVKQLGLKFSDIGNRVAGAGLKNHPSGVVFQRRLTSRKGSDMAEWPPSLRVREWPAAMGGAR